MKHNINFPSSNEKHRSDQITLVCLFHIKVQEAEDMTDHYGDFLSFCNEMHQSCSWWSSWRQRPIVVVLVRNKKLKHKIPKIQVQY